MPERFRYPLTFFGKEWRGILLRSDMSVGDWQFVALEIIFDLPIGFPINNIISLSCGGGL